MARRRSTHAAGTNLDSLMDTLTNVVGVLIIILILVQINVSQALKKIVSEIPPVTIEEFQTIQQNAQQKATEHENQQPQMAQLRQDLAQNRTELASLTPQLQVAETTAQKSDVPLLDTDTLARQLAEKRQQFAEQKKVLDALLAEQQRLKGLLDTTPVVAPPPAKIVRIPNSRPIPEKAKIERYLVTGGQLYPLEMEAAKKLLLADFQSARSRLEFQKTKALDGSTKIIYDQEKVAKHFEQRRLALRNADLQVIVHRAATWVALQLVPRPGQGEPLAAALQLTSRFQNELRRYKGTNTVLLFLVARDGFETYLRARDLCDAQGVPAGWELVPAPAYAEGIPEIEVNRLEEPPPADPNAIPIAPPKKKLD